MTGHALYKPFNTFKFTRKAVELKIDLTEIALNSIAEAIFRWVEFLTGQGNIVIPKRRTNKPYTMMKKRKPRSTEGTNERGRTINFVLLHGLLVSKCFNWIEPRCFERRK